MAKEITLIHVEKSCPKETPPSFCNKVDYESDTTQKTHGSDYSPSKTGGCVIILVKEHENKEDEEFKIYTYEINYTNE